MFDKEYIAANFPRSKHREQDVVKRFDTPEDYFDFVKADPQYNVWNLDGKTWNGGIDHSNYEKFMNFGDPTRIADAEKIFSQVETSGLLAVNEKIWNPSVVGAFPSIPAAIQNLPESMYSRSESEFKDETTPVNIYVDLFASAFVNADVLYKRGACILALAQILQTIRPTSVYGFISSEGSRNTAAIIIKIPTTPFDVDRGGFILGHPGFLRCFTFATLCKMGASRSIPLGWGCYADKDAYIDSAKHMVGFTDQDIYIDAIRMHDADYSKDPVAFINKTLEKYKTL